MSEKHVGYVRVSSVSQNSDRQLDVIRLDKVFEEKVSGRNAGSREVLNLCLGYLREHDTLHVHSIDRLARNMSDLLSIVDDLVKRDVNVKFHSEGLTFAPQTDDPAEKYRVAGDGTASMLLVERAVEVHPAHLGLQGFEAAYDGRNAIDWEAILLPAGRETE